MRNYLIGIIGLLTIIAFLVAPFFIRKMNRKLWDDMSGFIFSKRMVAWTVSIFVAIAILYALWSALTFSSVTAWIESLFMNMGSYLRPTFAATSEFVWRYWFIIGILSIVVYFLIGTFASEKKEKRIRTGFGWILAFLFVATPVIGWIQEFNAGNIQLGKKSEQQIENIITYDPAKQYVPLTIYPKKDSDTVAFPPNGDLEMSAQYITESVADITRRYVCENGEKYASSDVCRSKRLRIIGVAWHNPRPDVVKVSVEYILPKKGA